MKSVSYNSTIRGFLIFFPFITLVLLFILTGCIQTKPTPEPPVTKKEVVTDTLHGMAIDDPYRWLEDQESPETRAWIDEQNKYTDSLLGNLPYKEYLKKRYSELLRTDVVGIPFEFQGRFFFTKRKADQDLEVLYMRDGLEGEDKVLIDPHGLSADHSISVSFQGASRNGEIFVYGIRKGGEDEVALKMLDVDGMIELPDSMPRGRYFNISFLHDRSGFYYSLFTETGSRIYSHQLGSDRSNDKLIFGEGYDPGQIIYAGVSDDGKYLVIHVLYGAAGDKTEVFIKDLADNKPVQPVFTDLDAAFFVEVAGNKLVALTNWDAPNYRIIGLDLESFPKPVNEWQEIIPEGEAVIQFPSGTAGGKLCIHTLENVISKIRLYDLEGNLEKELPLPSLGSIGSFRGIFTSNNLFYSFSSFHIPTTIYRYDIETGVEEVWSEIDVPVNTDNIEVNQVWYLSKDSTRIPMFLVYRKGLKKDGKRPVYLTGYGGFNVSETARFSATAAIWVENGGVFALPNLRGGGEFGEEWHRAGMLENKQNVFDDFIAAAEWLIDNNYTNPDKLSIRGGSNGGLLVGACMNQRPELYKAVICTYPLLDMIRYHQFLVAPFWVPEYGSSEDPEQFKYILEYSPYHNVTPGTDYPATLFISGDADTRVAPLHARKMTALVQDLNGSGNPILLYYDTKSGHTSGGSVTKTIEDATLSTSFLFWQLGMKVKK